MSSQPLILIYTKDYCPYCVKAKKLLMHKGLSFQEIDITNNDTLRQEMIEKSSGRITVPQVFIGKTHVGGCDDLYDLEHKQKLDSLIAHEALYPVQD